MSRESSPSPPSDDSAVGSMSSCLAPGDRAGPSDPKKLKKYAIPSAKHKHKESTNSQSTIPPQANATSSLDSSDAGSVICCQDLEVAAMQTRRDNVCISHSTRTVLSCFMDLDIQRFETRTDHLINFISTGINKCPSAIRRPVSILWPDTFEEMVSKLAVLDALLINTEFREKPVEWMLKRGLTTVPNCQLCKDKMALKSEDNVIRWQCSRTQACRNYFMPVHRPSFFRKFEDVSLSKLLFSIYYWATCTPGEELYNRMKIGPRILDGIWTRISNVCRTALEKGYPRLRLTNIMGEPNQLTQPIDLISVKLNDLSIVCAKHPQSNLVRLGLHIPKVSKYNFVDLTESWFASGAHIRVSESKFLLLSQRRQDLKVNLVSRLDMVTENGSFAPNSAFGYIICQLAHVFKDFESSSVPRERVKYILAELQWRELYGTTPLNAFTNIISHMAQYGDTCDLYTEPILIGEAPESVDLDSRVGQSLVDVDYIWTEKYFYATVEPIDSSGKLISRYTEPINLEVPPRPDVRLSCHDCNCMYESFDFSMHLISHVEVKRKEHERTEYLTRSLIECKHCFKVYKREQITMHSTIFRCHLHTVEFACRICCIKLDDRAQFLQHMRQVHFESETPYHCPSCKYASSFQRDVYIHFQEEHRQSMIIMCPFCLRSFTVLKPELLTDVRMRELSQHVYNHIAEHYIVSKKYSCSKCCLCFTKKSALMKHQQLHHNPLEIRNYAQVKVTPFIVTKDEEKYCCKAIPMELFIANKRPNILRGKKKKKKKESTVDPCDTDKITGETSQEKHQGRDNDSDIMIIEANIEREQELRPDELPVTSPTSAKLDACHEDDEESTATEAESDDSYMTAKEDGTIHVRGLSEAEKFLQGGKAAIKISRSYEKNASCKDIDFTSESATQILIQLFSRMKRADGVVPGQSVVLTPSGRPAKCCECFHYITVDHFVCQIRCKECRYMSHCPRALLDHRKKAHSNSVN